MNKIKNISFLFFTRDDGCPDAFAPTHTGISAGALRYPAVNDGMANFSLGTIIGRLKIRIGQKTKKVSAVLPLNRRTSF